MPAEGTAKPSEAPPRAKRPTQRTIADRTGLAVTTVSRALSGDPRIAAATRARVAAVAREVGYVPDRAAQRLRTGRTRVISLLVNPAHEFLGFTDVLIAGLIESLGGTGYAINIIPDFISGDRVGAIEHILRNNLADGLIFTRTETFDPRVRLLLEQNFPFVSHGRTEFTSPHPFVDFDNETFARQAVARLVAKGRRRLFIALPDARFTFAQHLRYGFVAAAREAGVAHEIAPDFTIDDPPDRISAAMRARLLAADPPDGVVGVGEVMAMATLAALGDAGLGHGAEVDLVAKQASPVFGLLRPRIETVFEDVEETGRQMGRILLDRIAGAPPERLQLIQQPQAFAATAVGADLA